MDYLWEIGGRILLFDSVVFGLSVFGWFVERMTGEGIFGGSTTNTKTPPWLIYVGSGLAVLMAVSAIVVVILFLVSYRLYGHI